MRREYKFINKQNPQSLFFILFLIVRVPQSGVFIHSEMNTLSSKLEKELDTHGTLRSSVKQRNRTSMARAAVCWS